MVDLTKSRLSANSEYIANFKERDFSMENGELVARVRAKLTAGG
jgi:hypothetical protein